jgi:hypothetical protein
MLWKAAFVLTHASFVFVLVLVAPFQHDFVLQAAFWQPPSAPLFAFQGPVIFLVLFVPVGALIALLFVSLAPVAHCQQDLAPYHASFQLELFPSSFLVFLSTFFLFCSGFCGVDSFPNSLQDIIIPFLKFFVFRSATCFVVKTQLSQEIGDGNGFQVIDYQRVSHCTSH